MVLLRVCTGEVGRVEASVTFSYEILTAPVVSARSTFVTNWWYCDFFNSNFHKVLKMFENG